MSWIDESISKATAQIKQREIGIVEMRRVLGGFVTEQASKYIDAGATTDEAYILVSGMIERLDDNVVINIERDLMYHYLELWYDDVSGAEKID